MTSTPRTGTIFTRQRVRTYSWVFVVLGLGSFLLATAAGQFPLVLGGQPFLPDYLAHWTGGRMLLDGHPDQLYDPLSQAALQHAELPGYRGLSWFVSPPFAALMYVPLAWLPYGASAIAWLAVSVGMGVVAIRLTMPLITGYLQEDKGLFILAFLATPAVLEVIGGGQDSVLVLLIWVVALRLLADDRQGLAGGLLALALFKPQLLCFVPIVLIVRRQWRALASFVGVGLLLGIVSLALVGVSGLRAWASALGSELYVDKVQEGQTWKMQSGSALLTDLTGQHWFAYPYMILGGVLLWRALTRRHPDTQIDWALTALFTVSFSPHVVIYDLVILLPAAVWLFSNSNAPRLRRTALAAFILQWTASLRFALAGRLPEQWAFIAAPWSAVPLTMLCFVAASMPVRPSPVTVPATREREPQ